MIAYRLANGEALTTRAVSEEFGLTMSGALKILTKMTRVLPVETEELPDNNTYIWRLIDFDVEYDERELVPHE